MNKKTFLRGTSWAAFILILSAVYYLAAPLWTQETVYAQKSKLDQPSAGSLVIKRPAVEFMSADEMNRLAEGVTDRMPVGPVSRRGKIPKASAALTWTNLGPKPVTSEYWSGEDVASGRICAILVDPADSLIVYVAGAQGGVWKSTDNGVNWAPLTDHLSSLSSGDICFDPFDSDVIYYGTGEMHYSSSCVYGDGLFKTTDGGANWTKIANKATVGSYVSRIIVKPTHSETLHLGSDLGYMRSTNGGTNWNVILNYDHCNDVAVSPDAPEVVFAAIRSNGIYKSINSGANFTKLAGGLPVTGFKRINLAISPSNASVVYASFVANDGSLYGLYKTVTGGTTWIKQAATPNYLHNQGWYDNCIIVHPTNPLICYAGGVFPFGAGDYGLVRTLDGGTSWTDITVGSTGQGTQNQLHPDQHCLAIQANGTLWAGTDGGLWKTTDYGSNWTNRNQNLALTQFYSVAVHPSDQNFLLGGTQDQGACRYSGGTGWPQLNAGDGGPCAIEWDSPNIYYTTYVYLSYVYKWDNAVFQGYVTGPWSGDRVSWCNGPLVVDQNQANTLLAGTHRVYRTTNSGSSWTTISGDLTGGGHLRSLAVAEGYPDTIYSGSSDGRVYVTTDASTWAPRSTGLPAVPLPDIVLNPSDSREAWLCAYQSTGGRIYHTTDAGVSWADVTGDLSGSLMGMSLALQYTLPPMLYLGTDYGVYMSTNEGTNWTKDSSGLPSMEIYDLEIDRANNLLVAGTHGRGMYRAELPDQFSKVCTLNESGDECRIDVSMCSEIEFVFENVASNPPCMNCVVDKQNSDGSWRREKSWTYNNGKTRTLTRGSGTGLYRIVSNCSRAFSVTVSCSGGGGGPSPPPRVAAEDASSPWNLPGYVIGSDDESSDDLSTISQSLLSMVYEDTFECATYPKYLGSGIEDSYVDTLMVYFPFDSIRAGWSGNVRITIDAVDVYSFLGSYVDVFITAPGAPNPGPHNLKMYMGALYSKVHANLGEILPDPFNPIEVILEVRYGYIELDGIYVTNIDDGSTGADPPPSMIPDASGLKQNYPNPFNPTTEIGYDLAEDGHVKLEVYNVLGQRVAVLVDAYQTAGNKSIRWKPGASFSSGTYFCRLTAGSIVDTKKMVILK